MCVPSDGNICFFLSMETETNRQSREKVEDEGRKRVILGDHSAVKGLAVTFLSKHSLCVELIWALWREDLPAFAVRLVV